ncbi:MAG: pyruvate formate lyase-activating protein [Clostridiaceae bacterium]|nr:pyruvate formate lyase-activating protein [Clostridiaceae bacterium]
MEGRIHSFESLGAVDGPGIRFIIFMQGCSLKCKYCQNRDTWDLHGGQSYTTKELVDKILRYKNFITPNGGVTISGGEPLLQSKFLIELFTELKKYNIHTCIDTSGSFDLNNDIKNLINLTDLFLLDIKCINDEKAINLTGISNKKELAFATYLSDINKPMWIRQVLVPDITDDKSDLLELKKFIFTLHSVEKVEILPYHNLGKFKWENLGCKYELESTRIPNYDDVKKAKEILRNIKISKFNLTYFIFLLFFLFYLYFELHNHIHIYNMNLISLHLVIQLYLYKHLKSSHSFLDFLLKLYFP